MHIMSAFLHARSWVWDPMKYYKKTQVGRPLIKNKESEKGDKYFDHAWELKIVSDHESIGNTNRNWCTWNGS